MAQRRKILSLTQEDVAQRLHIERGTYAQYEVGRSLFPSTDLPALSAVLSCSVDYLLGIELPPDDDQEVLFYFRALPRPLRPSAKSILRAMSESKPAWPALVHEDKPEADYKAEGEKSEDK